MWSAADPSTRLFVKLTTQKHFSPPREGRELENAPVADAFSSP